MPAAALLPRTEPDPPEPAIPDPPPSGVRGSSRGEARAPAKPPPAASKTPVPYIVLVGLDLSEPGGRAWRFAFDLAALRGEAEIHAVVIGPRGFAPAVYDVATPDAVHASTPRGQAAPLPPLKVLQHRSAGGSARLMAMHFRTGRPDRAIVALANDLGADLIVVAAHPTTPLQRLFGGSTADRIARHAPCPVVVVKPKKDENDPGFVEFEPRR